MLEDEVCDQRTVEMYVGDSLMVAFSGDLLYGSGSSTLSAGGYDRLRSLARTLVRYPETDVLVKGHTDSMGSENLNQTLSESRAENVRNFLISEGVSGHRVRSFGFGESLPVAPNNTEAGRQQTSQPASRGSSLEHCSPKPTTRVSTASVRDRVRSMCPPASTGASSTSSTVSPPRACTTVCPPSTGTPDASSRAR